MNNAVLRSDMSKYLGGVCHTFRNCLGKFSLLQASLNYVTVVCIK